MAIGRTFQESLQKAIRGLETGRSGLDPIFNKDDEFEIILSEEPTIVILGQGDFHNKINILKKFDEALGQRQLTDYRLLDMRYSKQLVAREWI